MRAGLGLRASIQYQRSDDFECYNEDNMSADRRAYATEA